MTVADSSTDPNVGALSDRVPNSVIVALERASLRVPFEEARRHSRAIQRIAEKDLPGLVNAYRERPAPDEAVRQRFQERLAGLQARLDEHVRLEKRSLGVLAARQDLLHRVLQAKTDLDPYYRQWHQQRLPRLIVDYLLTNGQIDRARRLAGQFRLDDWTDIDVYAECHSIVRQLTEERSFGAALSWCSENRQSLKRAKSLLEFELRRQEFIEAVRRRQVPQALSYARRHFAGWLAETGDPGQRQAVWTLAETAMELLAFPPESPERQQLFSQTQWTGCVERFRAEFFRLYDLPDPPLLLSVLRVGLTLIKTPNCSATAPEHYNVNCPACQPELAALAADLPYAHHDHSRLVCRITGEPMDADNPPMVLPNGNVYSLTGLRKLAGPHGPRAVCPRTGEAFSWDDLRKLYIT